MRRSLVSNRVTRSTKESSDPLVSGSKVYRTNQFYKEQHCSFDNEILERSNAKPIYGRGCSSVGRAVALQAIGQEFDSPQLHQFV